MVKVNLNLNKFLYNYNDNFLSKLVGNSLKNLIEIELN